MSAAPKVVVHVPLAIDEAGESFSVPETAHAWRVRRKTGAKTGGRPRIQLDANKRPLELSLAYTLEDLEDILPPGTYRLDLVDREGRHVDEITVEINLGELRNAMPVAADEAEPRDDSDMRLAALPANVSDVRLVLEANVRSTQLAFLHNERTLATSLRMAETLRSGIQVLAESQADWIKSISSARGFFRNGMPPTPQLPAPAPANDDEEADDDGDDDEEYEAPQDWKSILAMQLAPLVPVLIPQIVKGLENLGKHGAPSLGDMFDWRRAAAKAKPERSERVALPRPATPPPLPPANLMQILASLPPDLSAKLMQARQHLTPDEQQRLLTAVGAMSTDDLNDIARELGSMSLDEIVLRIRRLLGSPGTTELPS